MCIYRKTSDSKITNSWLRIHVGLYIQKTTAVIYPKECGKTINNPGAVLWNGDILVSIPKEVIDAFGPGSVKTLVTADASGQPHAIVCGSIVPCPVDAGKVIVGEILMKKSVKNLNSSKKAAMVITSGMNSYELVLANPVRIDKGPVLEQMNANLAPMKLHANAVWAFDVAEIYNQSAGPAAGTKIA